MKTKHLRRSQRMSIWPVGVLETIPPLSEAQEAIERLGAMGYIATPYDPLSTLIQSLGRDNPRLLLSEGKYTINKTLTISRDIQIISLAPGRTIFVRETDFAGPMIQITANNVYLHGITFQDKDKSQPVIKIAGDSFSIQGCVFLDFKTAIEISTISPKTPVQGDIINNHFRGPGYDTGVAGSDALNILEDAIQINASGQYLVSHNHFSSWLRGFSVDTRAVDSVAAVTYSAFTSNIAQVGIIRYKGGVGSNDAGNVGTVQVF
jgi:hypothetical protein